MARFTSSLDQTLEFFASLGVTVNRQRELASEWSYWLPLSSSLEWEEIQGRWMHAQQLQAFAAGLGFSPSL